MDRVIAAIAKRQHGVVALRQLTALGLSASAVRERVATGRLHRVHRGAYAVGHARLTVNGRFMAAVLACGDDAVLSHRSAAALWGIRPDNRRIIDVSLPRGSGRSRPGIKVHVTRRIEATTANGIPCTTLARTLLDLAETVNRPGLNKAVQRSEELQLFDLSDVHETLAHANGRRGTPILKSVLAKYERKITRSVLEDAFLELCRTHGIPKPVVNQKVNGVEVDFHWPELRLLVETDGWEGHHTRAAIDNDRRRDQRHRRAIWHPLRYSWSQVLDDPQEVADELLALTRPPS